MAWSNVGSVKQQRSVRNYSTFIPMKIVGSGTINRAVHVPFSVYTDAITGDYIFAFGICSYGVDNGGMPPGIGYSVPFSYPFYFSNLAQTISYCVVSTSKALTGTNPISPSGAYLPGIKATEEGISAGIIQFADISSTNNRAKVYFPQENGYKSLILYADENSCCLLFTEYGVEVSYWAKTAEFSWTLPVESGFGFFEFVPNLGATAVVPRNYIEFE